MAHLIAEEGPLRGQVLELDEGEEWIVGRDPDVADLVIENSTVSRKHARIVKEPEGFFLENLSHVNPVLINGEERTEKTLLKEGDLVQIGVNGFRFVLENFPKKKKKSKKKGTANAYDELFGELEEPPPPAREEVPEEAREAAPSPEETVPKEAYDTIFEDVGPPSELPFHLLGQATLILKVIAGPNAGAEIGIEKNRSYVIGKDPNSCDIVFQDLSVSRNHARLDVSADGVIDLEDLGSKNKTYVSGIPISQKTVVTTQDMIALGTTVFLIIDREAPQETIFSSLSPVYTLTKESEQAEVEAARTEPFNWKKQLIPQKHLALATLFCAIFLIVFLSFFSLFKSEPMEIVRNEPIDQIQEALAKYKAIQFSFNPGSGQLFLTGHVLTGVDYQEMMFRIGEVNFIQGIDNTVVIDELLWKSMNDILGNNPAWRAVSIHSPEAGKFVASGYVQTSQQAAELNEYLTVNFPYLDRLENVVASEEALQAEIQSLLSAQGFGAISFEITGGRLLLTGGYNKAMQSKFDKLLGTLNALPGIARVQNFAISGTSESAGIDITRQYQITGSALHDGQRYSVVLNGKIYTSGDTIDEMRITAIGQKTILLEKDGLKYKINYR